MFVRIVKMSFHQEHIPTFLSIFEEKKEFIRASEGCNLLELYQDKNNPDLFFTYSYWNTVEDRNIFVFLFLISKSLHRMTDCTRFSEMHVLYYYYIDLSIVHAVGQWL